MDFSERVLVLQVGKFKEADLWVRFLSPSRGLVTAFAFGGSRSRRRFVGCLDIFNDIHVRVSASSRSAYLALQEGVLIKGIQRLRTDWRRLGVAVNCARFLQSFGIGPEGAGESLFLMRETVGLLEADETIPGLLPLFFRLRLAFDQGYSLELAHCSMCRKALTYPDAHAMLLLHQGRIVCRECASRAGDYSILLGGSVLKALADIQALPPSRWGEIDLPAQDARALARTVDGFVQYHVGITWDNGRFVRQ